jgi:hypothetical protein
MEAEAPVPPEKNTPKEKDKDNRRLLIIIIILIFLLLLLGWQYWQERGTVREKEVIVKEVSTSKDTLMQDLISLQAQYSTMKTSNQKIQEEINEKKDTITFLLQQVEKYKNDPYIIARLKKEMETLRTIMQDYVHTIDSLNTLNKQLVVQRNIAVESLKVEKGVSVELKKERSQLQSVVKTGSILEASNLKVEAVHHTFTKKETTTEKAKRAEKLKVEFTLAANRIAASGNRNIYIRVITPDAKELSKTNDESSIFDFDGTKGFYDAVQNFDYTNQEMSLVMYCESSGGFIPGKYYIKLYSDGAEIGETTILLK